MKRTAIAIATGTMLLSAAALTWALIGPSVPDPAPAQQARMTPADRTRACIDKMGNLGPAIIGACADAMAKADAGDTSRAVLEAMISPNVRSACGAQYPDDQDAALRCEVVAQPGHLSDQARDPIVAACTHQYPDDVEGAGGCIWRLRAERRYGEMADRDAAARREAGLH